MQEDSEYKIDIIFFKSLNRLLRHFIKPKSEAMSRYIYKTVKNILEMSGYHWDDIKHNLDGTDSDYWPNSTDPDD
jgi:hypothetical protein